MADSNDRALQKFEHAFEGHQVTTIRFRGRECWVARQIGEALGYDQGGRRFVTLVTTNWSEELIEGEDYSIVKGDDARNLAELFKSTGSVLLESTAAEVTSAAPDAPTDADTGSNPFASPRGALVLFESGLNIAAMKTEKPAGRALRRWLATEVLPAIRRTGAYAVTGGGPGAGRRALPSPASRAARAMRREAKRLEAQGMRAAAEHLRLSALEALVDRAMPEVRAVLAAELAAAELEKGEQPSEAPALPAPAGAAEPAPAPARPTPPVPSTSRAAAPPPPPRGRGSSCIKRRYNLSVKVPTPGFVTHPEDSNEELSRDGFPTAAEWRAFVEAWWATFGTRVVQTHHLVSLCAKRSMFGHFLDTGSERGRLTRLGMFVARRVDLVEEVFASTGGSDGASEAGTERRGFHVRIERSFGSRSKVSLFRLVRVIPE